MRGTWLKSILIPQTVTDTYVVAPAMEIEQKHNNANSRAIARKAGPNCPHYFEVDRFFFFSFSFSRNAEDARQAGNTTQV